MGHAIDQEDDLGQLARLVIGPTDDGRQREHRRLQQRQWRVGGTAGAADGRRGVQRHCRPGQGQFELGRVAHIAQIDCHLLRPILAQRRLIDHLDLRPLGGEEGVKRVGVGRRGHVDRLPIGRVGQRVSVGLLLRRDGRAQDSREEGHAGYLGRGSQRRGVELSIEARAIGIEQHRAEAAVGLSCRQMVDGRGQHRLQRRGPQWLVGRRRGVIGGHGRSHLVRLRRVLGQEGRFQPGRVGRDDRDAVQTIGVHARGGEAGDALGHFVAPRRPTRLIGLQEVDVGVDDEHQIDTHRRAAQCRLRDGHAVLAQQQARRVGHRRATRPGRQHADAHGGEAGHVDARDANTQLLARHRLCPHLWHREKGQRQSVKKQANAFRSADHLFPFCPPSAIIST